MSKLIKTPFSCQRGELTIRGHIYQTDDNNKNKPIVILSHGFLCNQKLCVPYAKELAKLGYLSYVFDFCGGGLGCTSDGKTEEMTLFTEKEDLLSVIKYVQQKHPGVPVSLLGCSQGGFVSGLIAAEYPSFVSKLILFYPALCIPDDARKGKMMFYHFDPKNIPDLLGKFPMKLGGCYAKAVIDINFLDVLSGYSGPVLLLHGDKDKIVDLDYAKKASTIYPNCEFHIIHNGGHMFKGKCDKEAINLLLDFMKY